MDTQYCRPILRRAFPGQPIPVHFTFSHEQQEDHAANAALLATARTAGWQPDAATASTLLGFQASPAPEPSANPAQDLATNSVCNTHPEARSFGGPEPRRSGTGFAGTAEPGLSSAELAAFQSLAASTLNPEQVAQAASTAAAALEQAVATNTDTEDGCRELDILECFMDKDPGQGQDAVAMNGCNKPDCPKHPHDTPAQDSDSGNTTAPRKYVPITMPDPITPKKAIERLKRGIKITNPLGEEVELGQKILDHWEGEDKRAQEKGRTSKTTAEKDARLAALPLIEKVIGTPQKILQNPDGSRTYEAEAVDPWKQNGKHYIVAFTMSDDTAILKTYRINDRHKDKEGKQIWPDTSGT